MVTSFLCVSSDIVIVAIINELRSYFQFVIVVTKQDLKGPIIIHQIVLITKSLKLDLQITESSLCRLKLHRGLI